MSGRIWAWRSLRGSFPRPRFFVGMLIVAVLATGAAEVWAQPVISVVNPSAVTYGITSDSSVTISGSGFQEGATITVGPLSGTTVAGTTPATATAPYVFASSTVLRFFWDNVSLPAGSYDVIVTNPPATGGLSFTLPNGFTVNAPQPTVSSASPGPFTYGITGSQSVAVSGSNFVLGATVTIGTRATDGSCPVSTCLSGVTVTGTIATPTAPFVHANASGIRFYWTNTALAPGSYPITVTNPAVAGGLSATLAGGFIVTAPQPAFAVPPVTPASATYGVTPSVALSIFGSNFVVGATVTISSATTSTQLQGVTVSGTAATVATRFVHVSSTRLSIYWVNTALAPGVYSVTVTNPANAGSGTDSVADAFTVVAPQPAIDPTTPTFPSPVTYGSASRAITINGSGFVVGATITVTSAGATISGQTVAGTAATASARFVFVTSTRLSFYIDWTSTSTTALPPDSYTVRVTNPSVAGGLSGERPDAFVVDGLQPVISALTPAQVTYGAANNLAISILGSGFFNGATIQLTGPTTLSGTTEPGAAASATAPFVFVNATRLSFYWVTDALPIGRYTVTVTNPAGSGNLGATLSDAFEVMAAVPAVLGTSPNQAIFGVTPSRAITITGTNFVEGARILIDSPTGPPTCLPATCTLSPPTVSGTIATATTPFVFVRSNQLSFYWPNTSLTPDGYRVTVVNPPEAGGDDGTLDDAFTVLGPQPVVSIIIPSSVEYNDTPSTSVRVTGLNFFEPNPADTTDGPTVTVESPLLPTSRLQFDDCVSGPGPANATTRCVHIDRRNMAFYWPNDSLAPGKYTVRVTNPVYAGAVPGELVDGFEVTAPQPQIEAIRPGAVTAGITPSRAIDVVGTNNAAQHLGFVASARLDVQDATNPTSSQNLVNCTANAGNTPSASNPCVFVNPGLLRFYWDSNRAADAGNPFLGPGTYNVTVSNPAARGGLTGTKLGAFRVTVLPELISIAPTGGVGSGARSAVVTLTATGFATGSVVRIGTAERDPTDPGPGNPTKPFYVQQQDSQVIMRSAFRAFAAGDGGTVVIDVTENQAQTADRRLAVTIESADGTYRFTCDPLGGATCNSGLTINRPPVVSAITPPLGVGATGKTPSISGQRFVVPGANPIADPGTMVTLPTGVTGACTAANATTINCTGVAVAATVVPGNVSVIVTNPDGGRTAGALTINAPPVISSLSPASATAGTSFTVTVLGSGFQAGLLQPEFGDITVNSFQRIDAATVDINVTIPSGAADGYRPLTITNPDGGVATAPQAFYIGTPPTDTASVLATFGEKGESLVQYQRSLGSSWGALSESPVLSSPPVWQVMKANPTRDERLLAVVDDQRRLTVHVWNGQTWANAQAAASSTGLARPSQTVDVAFEQQSGRGVVVYATTESTTLRYRLWDGTSWSAEALVEDLVNGQQTTGRPLWVRLEARPTTNDLVLVYGDQNNAIAASVWRGNRSQWEDTVLLTNAAASHDAPIFDVAFERATGQAMVVWATGVETTPHFRIWSRQLNDAGGWQSEATAPSIGVTTGQPIRALRMVGDASNAASPTNRIVLAASSGTAAPVLEALVWNGTQWSGGVPPLAASLRAQDGGRGFDLASQGGNGNVLAVYATTANPNGVSRTYSGTWSSEVDMSLPASASPDPSFPAWTELASSVGINDVAVTQFDTLGRVLLARWSGTVWSAAIEAQPLGSGLVGSPPVAGKSVAVTLAEDQIRNDGPGIVIPPTSPVETIIPGTPTLSAGTATINTANLSWSAVASDGLTTGGMVARYEVQQTLGSVVTTQSVNASQTPGGTEIYMVTGLSGAKTYLFNVRAVDAAGNRSPWSNRVTVVTPAAQPPPATGLAVPLGSIQRTSLALVWQRPTMGPDNAALAEYIVKYKTGGPFTSEQDFDIAQPEIRSDTEAITIEGLSFGVTYWFAVKVVDVDPSSPNSVMSSAIQATTADHAPDAITDLRVIGVPTSTSVTLRWSMPADDSPPIASYIVKYTSLPTIGTILSDAEFNLNPPQVFTFPGQPIRTTVEPFVETLEVTGLAINTQYWFSVKAVDDAGQLSPLSGSPTAITSVSLPDLTAPGAISDLAVVGSSTTSSSLDVSWTAVADDVPSEPVAEYDVRYATFPLTDEQTFSRGVRVAAPQPASPGRIERMTLVGLSSNTQYFVGIKAVDEAGNASLSNLAIGQTGLRRGYTLVSVPKGLATDRNTVPDVFEDEVGKPPTVYRWSSRGLDVNTGCYDGYPSAFTFSPQYTCSDIPTVETGLGYYLYNPSDSVGGRAILDAEGSIPVAAPTFGISLDLGFNMVGNPYEREIPLSAVRVKRGATGIPISYEAAVAPPNQWVGPSLLLFDGVVSRPYGVSDPEAVFKPWNGGWIQSFYDDVILVFSSP